MADELQEAAENVPGKERKMWDKTAASLRTRQALTNVVPELKAHPALTVQVDDFDTDDWLLNTPDGVIDLRTGQRQEPDPVKLMSKATSVGVSDAEPTLWLRFLDEATDGDKDLQNYLRRLVGYALTGSTQEQVFAFIHGPTGTGKSVFLNTIAGILGTYHVAAATDSLVAARGDRHPTDLAMMAGARLVTASETNEKRAWDSQRIKLMTGRDYVTARYMRQDFFTYKPRYLIVVVGNHEPELNGGDPAVMRRLHIIPFTHKPDNIDRLLEDRLKAEWPAILGWAVRGCLEWLKDGLQAPEAVTRRTAEYRDEEDFVGAFMRERCEFGKDYAVSRQELFDEWRRWCFNQGEEPGTLKQMKRKFRPLEREYDFKEGRAGSQRGYRGIRIKEEEFDGIEG